MSKTQRLLLPETCDEVYKDDPGTYIIPRTEEQLKQIYEEIDTEARKYGHGAGDNCTNCTRRFVCVFVFDVYNSDGDCLYSK